MQAPAVCRRFGVLVTSDDEPEMCVVCGQAREAHELSGLRLLTVDEAQAERQSSAGW
jgi:hypothetical protein